MEIFFLISVSVIVNCLIKSFQIICLIRFILNNIIVHYFHFIVQFGGQLNRYNLVGTMIALLILAKFSFQIIKNKITFWSIKNQPIQYYTFL